MNGKADLLARIEAWLERPAPLDETATLLIDLAEFVDTALETAELPPPVIVLPMRSKVQLHALDLIRGEPGVTLPALVKKIGGPEGPAYRAVKELERRQLIRVDRTITPAQAFPVEP